MTENEAIKNIKALNAVCWDKDFYDEEFAKAMAKAVKALHEIQQYRAIGTVEEITNLIKFLSFDDDTSILEDLRMLVEYYAIGTVEEFKALKEKSVAKKPIIHGLGQRYCPVCKCGGADHFYCARCGQKLG